MAHIQQTQHWSSGFRPAMAAFVLAGIVAGGFVVGTILSAKLTTEPATGTVTQQGASTWPETLNRMADAHREQIARQNRAAKLEAARQAWTDRLNALAERHGVTGAASDGYQEWLDRMPAEYRESLR
jgi:hypothetical protein